MLSLESIRRGFRADTFRENQINSMLKVTIEHGPNGALNGGKRNDIVIIIDSLRASNTILTCLEAGAKDVYPVSNLDKLKGEITIGERGGQKINGAAKISNQSDFDTWRGLNPRTKEILMSELLPGRNFAHNLLIKEGKIVANAIYERLEYFGAKNIPSGISGNISRGKIINPNHLYSYSDRLIQYMAKIILMD